MKLALALVALLLVASCGGGESGDDDGAAPPAPPAKETVKVVLTDAPPLAVLFNLDDESCTTVNFGDQLSGVSTPPVEVTLRSGGGQIIGTSTLSRTGGTFDPSAGCEWEVSFEVAAEEFYEAVVRTPQGEETATSASTGAETVLRVGL